MLLRLPFLRCTGISIESHDTSKFDYVNNLINSKSTNSIVLNVTFNLICRHHSSGNQYTSLYIDGIQIFQEQKFKLNHIHYLLRSLGVMCVLAFTLFKNSSLDFYISDESHYLDTSICKIKDKGMIGQ